MATYRLTAAERETHIIFDGEGDDAIITTYDRTYATGCRKNPAVTEVTKPEMRKLGGAEFRVAKRLIPLPRKPRQQTDESKANAAARMAAARAAKTTH